MEKEDTEHFEEDAHIIGNIEIKQNMKGKIKETNSSLSLSKVMNNKREMGTIKHFQQLCLLLDLNVQKNKGRKRTIQCILWSLFKSNTNHKIKKKYEKGKKENETLIQQP